MDPSIVIQFVLAVIAVGLWRYLDDRIVGGGGLA